MKKRRLRGEFHRTEPRVRTRAQLFTIDFPAMIKQIRPLVAFAVACVEVVYSVRLPCGNVLAVISVKPAVVVCEPNLIYDAVGDIAASLIGSSTWCGSFE